MATQTEADQLITLESAMNSGVLEVRFQDRTVRYQSAADLRIAYANLYNRVHSPNGVRRQTRMYTGKGL